MIGYAVLGGFVLDAIFGDPAWLPHPVVYMGKACTRCWGWQYRCSGAGRHWRQRDLCRKV